MLRFDKVLLRQGDFTLSADLAVPAAGVTAVIGPSGGGKSTLLAAIAGFQEPDEGRILWADRPLTGIAPGDRPVSMLFQDGNLFPHLTAEQNVGLGLRPSLKLPAEEAARVAEALARVGLTGLGRRKPGALSGGQQSRVALARVLVADRPLVLLDEPFSALGPSLRDEMLRMVANLVAGAGKTVLMVTHDPAEVQALADRVMVVADGVVSPPQPTGAIFADPPPALRAYLGR